MTTPDLSLSIAFWIVMKATAVLALAAIVQVVLQRRTSAAIRHLMWTLAIVGVLTLPILSLTLPQWTVVTRPAPADAVNVASELERSGEPGGAALSTQPFATRAESSSRVGRSVDGPGSEPGAAMNAAASWRAIIVIYVTGVIVMLVRLATERWNVRRFARQATDVRDRAWTSLLRESAAYLRLRRPVRLLRSCNQIMPMAFGTRRPAILIPATADLWPDDRRRAVLLHELAHVARFDCLTQMLAFAACAMYWFHPAAWWAARRLRIERELACDDRVIAAGSPGRDYAGHLLEIAYTLGRHRAPALAVSMARPGQLEGRILAALDAGRNRRVPAIGIYVAGAVIAIGLLLPLAAATSRVAAAETHADDSVSSIVSPPVSQEPVVGPSLKSWDALVTETAGRIIRVAAAAMGVPQDRLPGTWEIRPSSAEGTVHLRLVELNSSTGSDIAIDRLEGLTNAQLTGAGGPVQFRLRREAGTFSFEGSVRGGVGAGTFTFAPDPNFPAELAKRGFARPSAIEQYQMARADVGFAFIDELNTHGYAKPETSELVRAGQHGVRVDYVREMAALGYRLGSLAPLIELRDHGVSPSYVRELADLGYKGLSADEIRRTRDHGISPEYVRAMREAGYGSLPITALVNARDHGISAEYVRDMRRLGYDVSLDELIRARDHGVSVEFVREMAALGYDKLPLDSQIRVRDHGVSPQFIQELKALGYERLSIDDLVTLRDHGLSADRIRAANSRAGTRLPVDRLKSFNGGTR